jgi:hypothetical protein
VAKLNAAKRKALPKSDFGMPGERKYPMPDANHARNAEARASQAVNAGRMSRSTEAKIDAKADRVLGKTGRGLPQRGERTARNRDTRPRDEQHPRSHDEFEALGRDDNY